MKISGMKYVTESVTVDVDPRSAFTELKRMILRENGFTADAYVKNGKIIVDNDFRTSHVWTQEQVINDSPTAEQLAIFQAIDAFEFQVRQAVAISLKQP